MVCRDFILPEFCKPCLFLCSIQFAQLILHYPRRERVGASASRSAEGASPAALPSSASAEQGDNDIEKTTEKVYDIIEAQELAGDVYPVPLRHPGPYPFGIPGCLQQRKNDLLRGTFSSLRLKRGTPQNYSFCGAPFIIMLPADVHEAGTTVILNSARLFYQQIV